MGDRPRGPFNVLVPGYRHRWAFRHVCDRGDRGMHVLAIDLGDGHRVNDDGTTVTPSILCSDCGTHGFLTDGEWRST